MSRSSVLFVILLTVAVCMLVSYQTAWASGEWTVFSYPSGSNPVSDGSPSDMIFSLDRNILSLNTSEVATLGGSSAMTYRLLLSGNWAVCGTVDGSGRFIADPYATFVANGTGGYIQWSYFTPRGYSAPLMLGAVFEGCGAGTYSDQWGGYQMGDVVGTAVINTHPSIWGPEYNRYESVSHTFYVPYEAAAVPEPSGLFTLIGSMGGFACSVLRPLNNRRKARCSR